VISLNIDNATTSWAKRTREGQNKRGSTAFNHDRATPRCALTLGPSRFTHERSIALVELHHDEVLLPLRPMTSHTTEHNRIMTHENHRRSGNMLQALEH
jgi:hypothetical protein